MTSRKTTIARASTKKAIFRPSKAAPFGLSSVMEPITMSDPGQAFKDVLFVWQLYSSTVL